MEAIVLCGRPGKCCPVLAKKGRKFNLKTDDGKDVTLTRTQLSLLNKAIPKILRRA